VSETSDQTIAAARAAYERITGAHYDAGYMLRTSPTPNLCARR